MNKIEKLRKIINEYYCKECNDFGLCEYCEPKQTLVDIETVLKSFKTLIADPAVKNIIEVCDGFDEVKNGLTAYRRLKEDHSIQVRTVGKISKATLEKYKELKIWDIVKKYPEELGMIIQCKDYEEYKSTFSDINLEEEIEITEEQFNLVKNFFTKKEPEVQISIDDTVDHSKPMSTIDDTVDPNKPISIANDTVLKVEQPFDNCCKGKGLFDGYKCPHCGESYYREDYTTSTLIYSPIIIKDGKVVSNDLNTYSTHCHCLNCGKDFDIRTKDGKTIIE